MDNTEHNQQFQRLLELPTSEFMSSLYETQRGTYFPVQVPRWALLRETSKSRTVTLWLVRITPSVFSGLYKSEPVYQASCTDLAATQRALGTAVLRRGYRALTKATQASALGAGKGSVLQLNGFQTGLNLLHYETLS